MKGFQFRFAAVEKVRKVETERQRKKLAEAAQRLEHLEREEKHLLQLITREKSRMHEMIQKTGFVDHHFHELSLEYRDQMRLKAREKAHEVLEAKQEVIRQQRVLVEKAKKKMAMEVLREKEEERFYEEQAQAEIKEMDEISSSFWLYRDRDN